MTVMSTRAQAVAETLWELKKADKIATLSSIAKHAGFSPGANGQTIRNCLKTVRREWSHLQWWRAIADDGQVGEEQLTCLVSAGFEIEESDNNHAVIKSLDEHSMNWDVADDSQNDNTQSTVG